MTDRILTDADIVKRLRNIVEEPERWDSTDVEYVDDAADAIERLVAERDEARRMFCKCHAQAEAIGYAEGRGWDCFKEDGK